jgi:chitin disaccharide deacetylase
MRKVILNADDYGLCPSVTNAILRAHEARIVTSTSVLANLCPRDDLQRLRQSGLACGFHINLVEGQPLTGRKGLEPILDGHGHFTGVARLAWAIMRGKITLERLVEETEAQVSLLLEAGLPLDHVDSHRHAHHLPWVSDAAVSAAKSSGVRGIRVAWEPLGFELRSWKATAKKAVMLPFVRRAARRFAHAGLVAPQVFFGIALLEPCDPAGVLRQALSRLPEGVSEVALHLALADEARYMTRWIRTLHALLAMDVPGELSRQGLEATTFRAAFPQ